MYKLQNFVYSFDRDTQEFTGSFQASFVPEVDFDPVTGKNFVPLPGEGWWQSSIDGNFAGDGEVTDPLWYIELYFDSFGALGSGLHSLDAGFGSEFNWSANLVNHSLLTTGQTYLGNMTASIVYGSEFADNYSLSFSDDWAEGYEGNDVISGRAGRDHLYGGDGNDRISGGADGDVLDGGAGIDTLVYETGLGVNVNLFTLLASGGDATGDSFRGFENVSGSAYADTITGNSVANVLWGNNGDDTLSGGSGADVLYGGADYDTLYGDVGDDKLNGGSGNDALYGGAGRDIYSGGSGADRFFFTSVSDSYLASARDSIVDFVLAQGDKIDLTAIDANTVSNFDQAFKFIATAAFTGAAGELRYVNTAADTYVYGDINGDKKIDFTFHLEGALAVTSDYFFL